MENSSQMGCCLFLKWPSLPRLGYKQLSEDESSENSVKIIVGKERKEFRVDSFVLDKYPFRVLLEALREERKGFEFEKNGGIFMDVDSILFEHILWLVCNDGFQSSAFSMVQLNLREIIEFYAQDN